MITIRNSISIQVPLEKAFEFLAVQENIPLWNYYVKTVRKISMGNPVTGSQYHQVRKKDEQYFEITGFEKNKFIELTSIRDSSVRFKRQFIFSVTVDGCSIEDHFSIATAFPSFLVKLFSKKIRMAVYENLTRLKQLLETGKTTLRDGRLITTQATH